MFICDISVFNRFGKMKLDEALKPLSLDWRDLIAILVIEKIPGISQARLITFLQTDKANVTKLLNTMETRELIQRQTDPKDRRNNICYLSDKGTAIAPDLHKILENWENLCFRDIDRDDRKHFTEISEKIIRNLMEE
jgi:DNA-binding MarR family transcriptional regulator